MEMLPTRVATLDVVPSRIAHHVTLRPDASEDFSSAGASDDTGKSDTLMEMLDGQNGCSPGRVEGMPGTRVVIGGSLHARSLLLRYHETDPLVLAKFRHEWTSCCA